MRKFCRMLLATLLFFYAAAADAECIDCMDLQESILAQDKAAVSSVFQSLCDAVGDPNKLRAAMETVIAADALPEDAFPSWLTDIAEGRMAAERVTVSELAVQVSSDTAVLTAKIELIAKLGCSQSDKLLEHTSHYRRVLGEWKITAPPKTEGVSE